MIKINEIIVVEGKYDRQTLLRYIDGAIVETGGFRIFKDKELITALKKLAETQGLVILTDSDSAGFAIRSKICGSIDGKYIKNAYIPDIYGKERRKRTASKEGLLGVEGMSEDIIKAAFEKAGVTVGGSDRSAPKKSYTKSDLFAYGLSGSTESAEKRKKLARSLGLPAHLSANRLLELLNIIGWELK